MVDSRSPLPCVKITSDIGAQSAALVAVAKDHLFPHFRALSGFCNDLPVPKPIVFGDSPVFPKRNHHAASTRLVRFQGSRCTTFTGARLQVHDQRWFDTRFSFPESR